MSLKKKTFFSQIILLIILALFCVSITVVLALMAGTVKQSLFDFKNLNFENIIPVLIIGGIISCIVMGIAILFISRSVFLKVRDFLFEKNDNKPFCLKS